MQLVVAFPGPLGPVTGDKQLEIGYQKGLLGCGPDGISLANLVAEGQLASGIWDLACRDHSHRPKHALPISSGLRRGDGWTYVPSPPAADGTPNPIFPPAGLSTRA